MIFSQTSTTTQQQLQTANRSHMSKRPWEELSPDWYNKEQQQQAKQRMISNGTESAVVDRAEHEDKSRGGFSPGDEGELRNYPQSLGQNAPQEQSQSSSSPCIPEETVTKPKRALSAYNFFLREERQRILTSARQSLQHGETTTTCEEEQRYMDKKRIKHEEKGSDTSHQQQQPSFQEIGKIIGMRWQKVKVDPTQLNKYTKLADEDRVRFDREMDLYTAKKKESILKIHALDRARSAARRRLKGDDRITKGSEKEDSIKPSHKWQQELQQGTLSALPGGGGGEGGDISILSTARHGAMGNLLLLQERQLTAGARVPELGSYTAASQFMGEMSIHPPIGLDESLAMFARPEYETGNVAIRGLRESAIVQDPLTSELARRGLLPVDVQADAFPRSQLRYSHPHTPLLDSSSASIELRRRLNTAANILPPGHQALSISSAYERFVIPSSRPSLEHAMPSQYLRGVADEDVSTQNVIGGNRPPQSSSLSNPLVYGAISRGEIGRLSAGGGSVPSPQDLAQLLLGYPRSGPPTRDYNQDGDDPSQHPRHRTDVQLGNEGLRGSPQQQQHADPEGDARFRVYRGWQGR